MSWNAPSSSSGGAGFTHVSPPPLTISKRPKYSKFIQQELPACKPILTLGWVISTFILVSIVFIPVGVASLFASRNMVEIVYRYETDCIPPASRSNKVKYIQSNEDKTCNKNLTVCEEPE